MPLSRSRTACRADNKRLKGTTTRRSTLASAQCSLAFNKTTLLSNLYLCTDIHKHTHTLTKPLSEEASLPLAARITLQRFVALKPTTINPLPSRKRRSKNVFQNCPQGTFFLSSPTNKLQTRPAAAAELQFRVDLTHVHLSYCTFSALARSFTHHKHSVAQPRAHTQTPKPRGKKAHCLYENSRASVRAIQATASCVGVYTNTRRPSDMLNLYATTLHVRHPHHIAVGHVRASRTNERSSELPLTNTHARNERERDQARDVVGRGAFVSRSKQAVDLHSKLVSSVCW